MTGDRNIKGADNMTDVVGVVVYVVVQEKYFWWWYATNDVEPRTSVQLSWHAAQHLFQS